MPPVPQIKIDVNKLAEQLQSLAGPLATQAWDIMVRQEIAYGIIHLAMSALSLIGLIALVVMFKRTLHYSRTNWDDWDRSCSEGTQALYFAIQILMSLAIALLILSFVGFLQDGFMHLYNPYYYAIHDLVGIVKDKGV